MTERHSHIDVSQLPPISFDQRTLAWWGTLGFMVIEGFTLVLVAASYLYLRMNEYDWPPGRTPLPSLFIPTMNTLLLLFIMVPTRLADRAARRFDKAGVTRWLLIATGLSVIAVLLRWYELEALNVRYDAHAYASIAWAVVVLHGTLVLVDVFETGTLAGMFLFDQAKMKHYPDTCDAAMYQYFLSLIWLPLYLLIYWGPRVI